MLVLRSSCELENNIVSVERISEYMNLPTEVKNTTRDKILKLNSYAFKFRDCRAHGERSAEWYR